MRGSTARSWGRWRGTSRSRCERGGVCGGHVYYCTVVGWGWGELLGRAGRRACWRLARDGCCSGVVQGFGAWTLSWRVIVLVTSVGYFKEPRLEGTRGCAQDLWNQLCRCSRELFCDGMAARTHEGTGYRTAVFPLESAHLAVRLQVRSEFLSHPCSAETRRVLPSACGTACGTTGRLYVGCTPCDAGWHYRHDA